MILLRQSKRFSYLNGMLYQTATPRRRKMAKHYSHKNMKKGKKSSAMMMPRDAAGGGYGVSEESQMYHKGKEYYGPGYGHPSNMPPYPDMHRYPPAKKYLMTDKYPDTLREIDRDGYDNMSNLGRQPSDSMY